MPPGVHARHRGRLPAAGLLHFYHGGPGAGEGLSGADSERVPGHAACDSGGFGPGADDGPNGPSGEATQDRLATFGDSAKQRPFSDRGGCLPCLHPVQGGWTQEQDGSCRFLIRLGAPDRHGAVRGVHVGHVKGGDFGDPEHGVGHDGEDGGVSEPGKVSVPVGGKCGGCVGLFPTDPGNLTPAPVGSRAAEASENARGGLADRDGLAGELGRGRLFSHRYVAEWGVLHSRGFQNVSLFGAGALLGFLVGWVFSRPWDAATLTIVAIVVGPISAVLITLWRDSRRAKLQRQWLQA